MKRICIALISIFLSVTLLSAANPETSNDNKQFISYGFKIGFDATSLYMDNITVDNHVIERYNRDSQVGMNLTLFTRFNFAKFYLQTGIIGNYSRAAITFDKNSWNSESEEEDLAAFSMEGYCFDIPLQAGYNIIKDNEYCMALFCGPRIRIPIQNTYSTDFVNFKQDNIVEIPQNFITTMSFGLNCSIGNTFFDIEYDLGLSNISKEIRYNTTTPNEDTDIKMDRRHGTFSFSIGMIF